MDKKYTIKFINPRNIMIYDAMDYLKDKVDKNVLLYLEILEDFINSEGFIFPGQLDCLPMLSLGDDFPKNTLWACHVDYTNSWFRLYNHSIIIIHEDKILVKHLYVVDSNTL